MTKSNNRVCLVDDDAAVCESLRLAARAIGIEVVAFASANEFLAGFDSTKVGCIILDIQLPGMNGLELLEVLQARKTPIPIILLSGHADVQCAVAAIRKGAHEVLEKPFTFDMLADKIKQAFVLYRDWQQVEKERQEIDGRMAKLTAREREVMTLMADGMKNVAISKHLGISMKTLDIHRTKVLTKLKARTWADIVRWRLLYEAGVGGVTAIKAGGFIS